MAFTIPDIKKLYEILKESGVDLVADIKVFENGLSYFFLKDPDGILVECMEEK